jgi:hypothetical protein
MTETEIRERTEAYIDEALAEYGGTVSAEEREAAIERVEAASRELLTASQGRDGEPVAA